MGQKIRLTDVIDTSILANLPCTGKLLTCDNLIVMVVCEGIVATVQEKICLMLLICCETAAVCPCITDSL